MSHPLQLKMKIGPGPLDSIKKLKLKLSLPGDNWQTYNIIGRNKVIMDLSKAELDTICAFGYTKALKTVDISNCELQTFPTQSFDISVNKLTELSQATSNVLSLKISKNYSMDLNGLLFYQKILVLDISGIHISENINKLKFLKQLRELYMRNCCINSLEFVAEISIHLLVLDCSENLIEKLPFQLANLSNLQILNLNKNKIENCAVQLPESLIELHLNSNRITNPPILTSTLEKVDLSKNKIFCLNTCIKKTSNLKVLNISENKLTELPDKIGFLKFLKELYFDDNPISWPSENVLFCKDIKKIKKYLTTFKLKN
ncbi:probable serine/threonine-protein kinase DDB_G0278509 [Octopus sinensis]|uniref:Probable serine/threonine-protein kinase DDB_G0278509 n=1 Tax=Octopus sinensis TaxID=2607531 RepID=A0A6P7U9D0_9MOLL|nr:probable serine/threonine-protein kinase DDB_G0278509 [Octopus sinensis]